MACDGSYKHRQVQAAGEALSAQVWLLQNWHTT
jgi:hypothetical protein